MAEYLDYFCVLSMLSIAVFSVIYTWLVSKKGIVQPPRRNDSEDPFLALGFLLLIVFWPVMRWFNWLKVGSTLEKRKTELIDKWRQDQLDIHLMPIEARLEAQLPAVTNPASGVGLLGVVGPVLDFYHGFELENVLTIRLSVLRAYGLVDEDGRLDRDDPLEVMIVTEDSQDDWYMYRFTLPALETWTELSAALYTISGLSPGGMSEPVNAMAYRQNMLGHWERTEFTMLLLIPQRLLLNWQTIVRLDQLREIAVLPSPGVNPLNAAMLVIKHTAPDGSLQTVGFDMLSGKAEDWARELHARSGAPLHMVTDRKKKTQGE